MADPIQTAIAKGATDLVVKSLTTLAAKVGKDAKSLIGDPSSDLEKHFRASYDRCTKIKTLLNRAEPIDLLTIYVNTKFKLPSQRSIDDYNLIEKIPKNKKIAIIGTGGGGKTIFMKYLWVSIFVGNSGRVPVFIELRRTNDLTNDDLMTYIYQSIIGSSAVISERAFTSAAKKGDIIFILDGFDELSTERKISMEKQVLKFCSENPDAILIVSGRPDSRFDAWQQFTVYQVAPMTKPQVLDLISKFTYDKVTKRNFSQRVKADLYDRHTTFLSNPLLVTMMMLTFDQFADIPEKIFVFCEQAFDTFFSKHDATKDGFKRQHKTGLSIDVFKQCLSYMCLLSYYDEKYEFSYSALFDYVSKALRVVGLSIKNEDFIEDLREAVCLIQEEGIVYVFTHRSFQEYFTALCLANLLTNQVGSVLEKIHLRHNDNVVRMFFEMNPSKLEKEFLLPKLRQLLAEADESHASDSFVDTVTFLALESIVHRGPQPIKKDVVPLRINFAAGNNRLSFILLLRRFYPDTLSFTADERVRMEDCDSSTVQKLENKYPSLLDNLSEPMIFSLNRKTDIVPKRSRVKVGDITEISQSGFALHWICIWQKLREMEVFMNQKLQDTQKSIDDILGIGKVSVR